ncbi:hypothetical protein TELCIR_20763 [Teladorsagia circumcincta]|uniref:Uncharacterized protein n=1 Tax=Teladorsagia circumcincta TaxID=45464 RepID=A0A2G9TIM5_TELCI|nr:hypothetical protein TELCIR_20763 [Teladorsagia circumcincta]
MVHANKTIMDKTLSKSTHLVKLRGVLYEPNLKAYMSRIVRPDVMTRAFSSLPDTKAPLLS